MPSNNRCIEPLRLSNRRLQVLTDSELQLMAASDDDLLRMADEADVRYVADAPPAPRGLL